MNPWGGMISWEVDVSFAAGDRSAQCDAGLTVAVFVVTLGKLWVRSTHGLIRTAPAGSERPRSLRTVSAEIHNPAPAESPAKTSFEG